MAATNFATPLVRVAVVLAGGEIVVRCIAVNDVEIHAGHGTVSSNNHRVSLAGKGAAVAGRKSNHSGGQRAVVIERLRKRVEHGRFVGARQECAAAQDVKAALQPGDEAVRVEIVVQPDFRRGRIEVGDGRLRLAVEF